jgi:DNA topoisomerase-1
MAVYAVSQEEDDKIDLPELSEGAVLTVLKFDPKQHFTQPPPRFTEASLVKEMEERGIGRPSTYAAILSTIRDKGYVDLVKGAFRPTELGFIVNDLIVESFPDIFDVDFTARMEDELDRVESDEVEAAKVLSDFYGRFSKELASAGEEMLSMKGVGMPTDLTCPACGRKLRIKVGRNGHFLACDGYPECTFTSDYERDEKGRIQLIRPAPDEKTDKTCPACKKPLVRKQGRYGPFLACTGYPACKHTESVDGKGDERDTGVACPAGDCTGSLVKRQSKRGKVFYGCSRYPDCKFAVWDKPVAEECPDCGSPILLEKTTKRDGPHRACPNKECAYKRFPESGDS